MATPNDYVSSAAASVLGGVAAVIVTLSAGAVGDVVEVHCWANNTSSTWTGPAGWISIGTDAATGQAGFQRVIDGTEGATATFTRAVSTVGGAGVTLRRRRAGGTVQAVGFVTSATTSVVLPTLTSAAVFSSVAQFVARVTVGATTWNKPSTATKDADITTSGGGHEVAIGHEWFGTGATGTRTWSHNGGSGATKGMIVMLNPAAGPAVNVYSGGVEVPAVSVNRYDGTTEVPVAQLELAP